jgi:hypothetical protein
MLFAQAFPAGAQLLPVTAPAGPVKVWATRAIDGTIRVTAINQDATAEHDVQVVVPNATAPGAVETMAAPALDAPAGVTLGGQTFGAETTTGTFPAFPGHHDQRACGRRLHRPGRGRQRRAADDRAAEHRHRRRRDGPHPPRAGPVI